MTNDEFKSLISASSIIAAGFALNAAAQAGTPITGALVAQTIDATTSNSENVAVLIQSGVDAFKELSTTGKLPATNAAFDYLLVVADQYLPGLTAETLRDFIEKVVPLISEVYQALSVAPSPEGTQPTVPAEPAG